MTHYHGTPITGPRNLAGQFLRGRHAFVSFAATSQIVVAAEVCQSFALDNGAFSFWKSGRPYDFTGYEDWACQWTMHPACDWCLIPDLIDGSTKDNDALACKWPLSKAVSVPVYHLHEEPLRLSWLAANWPRVAIGSSGEWPTPGTPSWWGRMADVMAQICRDGRPAVKLHGLRMLSPAIFPHLPFASADSTNVARNVGIDKKWERGAYMVTDKLLRASIIAERIESRQSAARWEGPPKRIALSSPGLFDEMAMT